MFLVRLPSTIAALASLFDEVVRDGRRPVKWVCERVAGDDLC